MPLDDGHGGGSGELDRRSPVPLYHQLERALLELIVGSGMAPDARFPSEAELSARFGVTRPTVRQALERLVRVGVLRKERGRGTYVATVPDHLPSSDPADRPTVKVIMPSLTELIHLRVLAGIVDEAHSQRVQVVLAHSDNRAAAQERELADVTGVSGIVLWPVGDSPRAAPAGRPELPLVFLDRYLDTGPDHVVVDDIGGARAATEHLIGLGHRRIAFVHAERRTLSSVGLRLDSYRRSLQEHGIAFDRSLIMRVGTAGGASLDRALNALLALDDPPAAAFCVNDVIAVQVFTALRRRGVQIPEDFSIAGFDDLEGLPAPVRLTTVRRATEQMGRRAIQLLVERIRDPAGEPRHIVLPTRLVVGDTTGPYEGARVRRKAAL